MSVHERAKGWWIMKRLKLLISTLLILTLILSNKTYVLAYEKLDNTIYYLDSDINKTNSEMIVYCMMVTPPEIYDLFKQEGVHVNITQTVPRSERTFDGYCQSATLTWNGSKKITKVGAPVEMWIYHDVQRVDAYFHECGHALDYLAEFITGYYRGSMPISNSSEWQDLYARYGSTMAMFDPTASVNMYNANEAFAEAFRFYYSYPQLLQANCPEVYTFVANQIAKYTAYVPPLSYSNFNYEAYYNTYPDVAAAYGLDKKALWDHYINCGQAEGRTASRIIKPKR